MACSGCERRRKLMKKKMKEAKRAAAREFRKVIARAGLEKTTDD